MGAARSVNTGRGAVGVGGRPLALLAACWPSQTEEDAEPNLVRIRGRSALPLPSLASTTLLCRCCSSSYRRSRRARAARRCQWRPGGPRQAPLRGAASFSAAHAVTAAATTTAAATAATAA